VRLDLERLREGRPGCPSDLQLDRLVAGEPAPAAAQHLGGCALCTERVEERRQGFAAFAEVHPAALRARIEQLAPQRRRWPGRLRLPLALAAAAAAAVIVAARPGGPATDQVRAKGGLGLHVHRMRGDGSEEMASGDRFAAGERLRFAVDVPERGYVTISGVEASGRPYQAWPVGGGAPALLPAGERQLLPGAVALDARRGRETLYLIHCLSPERSCSGAPPRCPAGCAVTGFVIDKGE
jgi:hypothetical protein